MRYTALNIQCFQSVAFRLLVHACLLRIHIICVASIVLRSVYIFSVGDNLRSRNKCVVPLCSSVSCVKYFNSCMYVGLENGSLAVFEMDEGQLM